MYLLVTWFRNSHYQPQNTVTCHLYEDISLNQKCRHSTRPVVGLKHVAIRMRTRLCTNYLDGASSVANNNNNNNFGRDLGNSPLLHRFPALASGVHGAAADTRDSRQPGGIHTSGAKPSRSGGLVAQKSGGTADFTRSHSFVRSRRPEAAPSERQNKTGTRLNLCPPR